MRRVVPLLVGVMLLVAAVVVVFAKKPPSPPGKPPISDKARFNFGVLSDFISTDPDPTWFDGYDDGWVGNKQNRVDWSSGYIRNWQTTTFTIKYLEEGTGLWEEMILEPCKFSGVRIESNNRVTKRPVFRFSFREMNPDGSNTGRMWSIGTSADPSETRTEIISMTYDSTAAMGSWTIIIRDACFIDISDGGGLGILGTIPEATFVITRMNKV